MTKPGALFHPVPVHAPAWKAVGVGTVEPGASEGYARPTVSIKESLCSTPP